VIAADGTTGKGTLGSISSQRQQMIALRTLPFTRPRQVDAGQAIAFRTGKSHIHGLADL
jgi:hypothetical protein